eukprot:15983703-Heterocapsa_arctica.AAC.1
MEAEKLGVQVAALALVVCNPQVALLNGSREACRPCSDARLEAQHDVRGQVDRCSHVRLAVDNDVAAL